MKLPPRPLPLTKGCFRISASSLEAFMKCPRSWFYRYVYRRESTAERVGMTYGNYLHSAMLAPHYRGIPPDVVKAGLVPAYPADIPADDYRTAAFTHDLYTLYHTQYEAEPFTVATIDGKPAVECQFALPIGEVVDLDGSVVPVVLTGILDLMVRWCDMEYVVIDHKSSSVAGETFWLQFDYAIQQLLYCLAAQKLLGVPIGSFVINALFVRPKTKTGKGVELFRQRYPVDPELLDEALVNAMEIVGHMVDCFHRGCFPAHSTACIHRYGKCEYHEVCRQAPSLRYDIITSSQFRDKNPSPFDTMTA